MLPDACQILCPHGSACCPARREDGVVVLSEDQQGLAGNLLISALNSVVRHPAAGLARQGQDRLACCD